MVWRNMTSAGVGIVLRINGLRNAKAYVGIIENELIAPFDLFAMNKEKTVFLILKK